MGDTVVADSPDSGVATDYLAKRVGGRVAIVGCFNVGGQDAADMGQLANELSSDLGRLWRCAESSEEAVSGPSFSMLKQRPAKICCCSKL